MHMITLKSRNKRVDLPPSEDLQSHLAQLLERLSLKESDQLLVKSVCLQYEGDDEHTNEFTCHKPHPISQPFHQTRWPYDCRALNRMYSKGLVPIQGPISKLQTLRA